MEAEALQVLRRCAMDLHDIVTDLEPAAVTVTEELAILRRLDAVATALVTTIRREAETLAETAGRELRS